MFTLFVNNLVVLQTYNILGTSLTHSSSVWPEKNRQKSIKVAQKSFHKKRLILESLQKLPKNVGDLGKLIDAKGFKRLPKVQKIAQSGHTAHPQRAC